MASRSKYDYPYARRDPKIIDDYHGVKVQDYYRHFEDPFASETLDFIEAQNKLSQSILENCKVRPRLKQKLRMVFSYTNYGIPFRYGDRYFHSMRLPDQDQDMYCTTKSLDSEPEVLVNSNQLTEGSTISISGTWPSKDGKRLAYALSESGSDWKTIHVMEVESHRKFPEVLERVKFSDISWTKDTNGFFYSAYPLDMMSTNGSETSSLLNQKLYYHRIGESQGDDLLIAQFPDSPSWYISGLVSDCGHYLMVTVRKGVTETLLYYADLSEFGEIRANVTLHPLTNQSSWGYYWYVTNIDRKFLFRTNRNAPNYRISQIELGTLTEADWVDVVKEDSTDQLVNAICVHYDKILVQYLRHVRSEFCIYSLQSGEILERIPVDMGTIRDISAKREFSEIFYEFSSLAVPGVTYRLDLAEKDHRPKIIRKIKLNGYKQEENDIEQHFYFSADKTKVPLFILQKRDRPRNQRCPCLLYAYGGFGFTTPPGFSFLGALFVEYFNGIYALANIRGGGEYGERWHNAGRLLNKQNSFEDFQSAAKYLVCKGFTLQRKICIIGGSNGGLLVAACINQKPYLFGAAIARVGVMDMLRFPKFTAGHGWRTEYGDPQEEKYFHYIYKYSPLHNIRSPTCPKEQYPATLIVTANYDDRVSPLHSYKYTAEFQHAVKDSIFQKNPILLRIYDKQGHGNDGPVWKRIEGMLDAMIFCYQRLHILHIKI